MYRTTYRTAAHLFLVFAAILHAGDAMAQRGQNDFEPGLNGYLQLMVGGGYSKSVSRVSDDTERIDSLDQEAEGETSFTALPMYRLTYTLENERTQFFLGTPEENFVEGNFLVEIGARQKLAGGTILGASWIPYLPLIDSEVWEDPFLLGSNREETDQESQAFRLTAASIMGSPITLRYGFGVRDIDDELSGTYLASLEGSTLTSQDLDSLDRDSDYHFFEAMYRFRLQNGLIIRPQLGYLIGDAEGDANNFDRYSGKVSFAYVLAKWRLFGNIFIAQADYDEVNPIFGKTRDDNEFGGTFGVSYLAPFGYKDWSVNLFTSFREVDSNIKFYDSTRFIGGLGLAWMF